MSLASDIYTIQCRASDTFADLYGGNPADGTPVNGWQDMGGNPDGSAFNQRWLVSPVDGQPDVYTLHNLHSGTFLDLSGGGSANGTRIQGWEFLNNRNQQWKISKAEVDGFWRLQSIASGTFMDLSSGIPNDGTQIQGWERLSNNNQLWAFRSVTISSSNINKALKANQFIKQTFPSYLQNTRYISIPNAQLAKMVQQLPPDPQSRSENSDSLAYAVKAAVEKWNNDNIHVNGCPFVFGIVFVWDIQDIGHAQNWFVSEHDNGIIFLDPTNGFQSSNIGVTGQVYFGVY